MRAAVWTFVTLASHWRRHPGNLAMLIVGISVATALWSGVQALNHQARQSYDRAAAVFKGGGVRNLVAPSGGLVSESLYVKLRLAGWNVSPILEGWITVGSSSYRLVGLEPLTLPRGSQLARVSGAADLATFLKPPGQAFVSPETWKDLTAGQGRIVRTNSGRDLPPISQSADLPPRMIVVDIGLAQALLDQPGRVSRLLLDAPARSDISRLPDVVGTALRLAEPDEDGDLERLTDSFHLNLTAFGFLAFIVGLFIVHASLGLAFEQRLAVVRTMRAVGIPAHTVMLAVVTELSLIALSAGALGMVGGYLLASALLPDVAATLSGLYGAPVAGSLRIEAAWWLSGLGMALFGTLTAAGAGLYKTAALPLLSLAGALTWREAQERYLKQQAMVAGASFILAAAVYWQCTGLASGFVVIAGILLGSALLLPLLLSLGLQLFESLARTALTRWFWADSRQQLSALSLALMALLLALAANVGVGTMVDGFRQTFTGWLDQRLIAEVYFEAASNADAALIEQWLETRPEVDAILPVWRGETRLSYWPVDVIGFKDHATYRDHFPMQSIAPGGFDEVARGAAVLVSEQLARRLGLETGGKLVVPTPGDPWQVTIAGIYPDYGNPKGQLRVGLGALVEHWPDVRRASYSLRVKPDAVRTLMDALRDRFGAGIARMVDQASLKALSNSIFQRTFAVTTALNVLTLMVSGVALVASLITLSSLRIAQVAPVWAIGLTRRHLALLELARLVSLGFATAVLAIPLGLALAWCLVAVVNVQAFGWRLPLHLFPAHYLRIIGLAIAAGAGASVIPILNLMRLSPAGLLRRFSSER